MPRFIVARPLNAGLDDTYATPFTGSFDEDALVLADEALWPDGTRLLVWLVEAPDAGAARLISPGDDTLMRPLSLLI